MFSTNAAISDAGIELINLAHDLDQIAGCTKCSTQLRDTAPFLLARKIGILRQEAEALLSLIPLASLQSPQDWIYEAIGLITAQTVSGTGLFSDVTSAFTDLFGTQSGAYNQKLRSAEDLCRASLRAQAHNLGGNAVLAVDVDYAEVGGQRAMLMVCMTGTAVILDEASLGPDVANAMIQLRDKKSQLSQAVAIGKQCGIG